VWVAGLEEDDPPSPKLQLNVNGPTPADVVAVKATGEVASADVGLKLKFTLGAATRLIV